LVRFYLPFIELLQNKWVNGTKLPLEVKPQRANNPASFSDSLFAAAKSPPGKLGNILATAKDMPGTSGNIIAAAKDMTETSGNIFATAKDVPVLFVGLLHADELRP